MDYTRCPHCGSPVTIRGNQWECGWCGDFGRINSPPPARPATPAPPSLVLRATVTAPEPPQKPTLSRAQLEDRVRRWDLSDNEWACRDLLITAFPQAVGGWSAAQLADMDTMDLILQTAQGNLAAALQMMRLLLNTAEEHLSDPDVARQLLGWDLYDLLLDADFRPLLLAALRQDDRLARQLFQSAYFDLPQRDILDACARSGEHDLHRRLTALTADNRFASPDR